MKYTLILLAATAIAVNGAVINLNTFAPGGPGGAAFFDNAGNALTTVQLFTGVAPTNIGEALALVGGGSALLTSAIPGPGGGLVNGTVAFDNQSGVATGQNLFAIFTNAAQTEAVAYDLATVLAVNDTPTAPVSEAETITSAGRVTLGSFVEGGTISYSAIGAPDGTGLVVTAAAIPEPSALILGGVALLGGLIRRRR